MGVSDRQISRRSMIAKTAAVSAAVWAAPVIDSVVSAASAVSGCVGGAAGHGSWMYVVYSVKVGTTTTIYYSGYSKNDSGTDCTPAAYPNSNGAKPPITVVCGGFCYTLGNGSPAPLTYGPVNGTGPACPPASSTAAPLITTTSSPHPCSFYLNLVSTTGGGTTVTPASSNVTVIAAFCFGGGSVSTDSACSSPTGCAALSCN